MENPESTNTPVEPNNPDDKAVRFLLDKLIEESRLYKSSKDYLQLLEFVSRLRNFAPFNALLLQMQKPGLSYAASAADWETRFGRRPKEEARPLLILWPFGPVALVYDVQDTVGKPLPEDVDSFFAKGPVNQETIAAMVTKMAKKRILYEEFDAGDQKAGSIRRIEPSSDPKDYSVYQMKLNRNHAAPVQFATIAHELAHLFLGHLGADKKLNIPNRPIAEHAQVELEAESVAFVVCGRNGVTSKSQTYLSHFVEANTTIDQLDLYQVMRAAGQIETLLRLTSHTRFERE